VTRSRGNDFFPRAFELNNDSYHIKEDNKDSKVVCIKILNQDTTQVKPAF
jgi:hypothetical protein